MNEKQWKGLVKIFPHAQLLIDSNLLYDTKEKQLKAVKENWSTIKFIHNPDKDVQLEAVKQNGLAIRFIPNPDKDALLEAVRQNTEIIQFIPNPQRMCGWKP